MCLHLVFGLVSKKLDPPISFVLGLLNQETQLGKNNNNKKSHPKFDIKLMITKAEKQAVISEISLEFCPLLAKSGGGRILFHIPGLLAQNNKKQWFVVNQ